MEQWDRDESNLASIGIKEAVQLLWSWAWLIVLTGALAGAAAFIVSKRMTPTYAASARLLVSAPSTITGVDPSLGTLSLQTLISTYSEMLTDNSVLEGVIERLQLQTTPDELARSITVKTISNTQLLEITVEDTDPQRAAKIADTTATVFVERVQSLRSQRYASIRNGLAEQIDSMEQQMSATSDQIATLEQEIASAAAQKAAAIGTQLAAAATQTVTAMGVQSGTAATQTVSAMEQQIAIAATQTMAAAPPSPEPAALVQLQERLTQYRTIYSNLVLSYEQVRLAEEQTSTNVVVSESATVPSQPVSPKKTQIALLAALLGMALVTGVVLVAEKLDDGIRDPEELRRKVGLPILGVILWHKTVHGMPVVLKEPRSPAAEAFRSLRTNITYAAIERPLRRILITSATPQDGKTTVACGLAAVLSQGEKQVLLLDADMRRPQMHDRFGLHNHLGLSDLFVGSLEHVSAHVQMIDPPKLGVLTAGTLPPNPAELLTSHRMLEILDALNRDFDVIVIDTPPVLSVTDAAALVPFVDGVILVARPGTTKLAPFRQAREQLRAVGARVLGVVLDGVNPSSRTYGYYYDSYHSKYSRYYEPAPARRWVLPKLRTRQKERAGTASAEASCVEAEQDTVVSDPPNLDESTNTQG